MGMTDEEMQETVDLWRQSSPAVVRLWRDLETAATKAVSRKSSCLADCGVLFEMEGDTERILWMTLPSGRRIAYWGATYDYSDRNPDRKCLSYMGIEQQTKKWARLETWGGKLTENLVQATSRDILLLVMQKLYDAGYDIRAHVHDEVIVTEPLSSGRTVEMMSEIMGQPIPWAPGLPLRADGYEGAYYFKD